MAIMVYIRVVYVLHNKAIRETFIPITISQIYARLFSYIIRGKDISEYTIIMALAMVAIAKGSYLAAEGRL
jgi:hypothetical protein